MYFPTKEPNHGEHGEHGELKDCSEDLIDRVLTAATNVHRELGPGLLESVYKRALMVEFAEAKIPAEREVEIPVKYHGKDLGVGFRADIIVADCLLLELKCIESVTDRDGSDHQLSQVTSLQARLHYQFQETASQGGHPTCFNLIPVLPTVSMIRIKRKSHWGHRVQGEHNRSIEETR